MKKSNNPGLILHRETLRILNATDLSMVVGGQPISQNMTKSRVVTGTGGPDAPPPVPPPTPRIDDAPPPSPPPAQCN